ncbi:MAG: SDR family oxidoreductase [Myxococcota bacterium]
MMLKDKVVALYGAGGAVGTQASRVFGEQGAKVYAADRDATKIEAGHTADQANVDALSEEQVSAHLASVVRQSGRIDVVLNCVGSNPADYMHGHPAVELSLEQFMVAQGTSLATQFVTAKHAFPHMEKQKSGVVVFLTSTLAKVGSPHSAALTAAHAGAEGLVRSLAREWGPAGVRVLGVRSEAMPESDLIKYTFGKMGDQLGLSFAEMQRHIEGLLAIPKLPSATDTAGVLAFAASDLAGHMTGTVLNQSNGHVLE